MVKRHIQQLQEPQGIKDETQFLIHIETKEFLLDLKFFWMPY